MWKAFFVAVGISMIIVGAESLLIDKAVLAAKTTPESTMFGSPAAVNRELVPAEWFPWSLISGGVVVIIYSYSLPKMVSE